ncbi:hypothetical protein AALB16_06955 [Lachnospiraceae bacterium 62-35]
MMREISHCSCPYCGNILCCSRDCQIASAKHRSALFEARAASYRKNIASLNATLQFLEKENQKLRETVSWMHDVIWKLIRENRHLRNQNYMTLPPAENVINS